jgi:hypothetical protein
VTGDDGIAVAQLCEEQQQGQQQGAAAAAVEAGARAGPGPTEALTTTAGQLAR